jgi:hypothetical protein
MGSGGKGQIVFGYSMDKKSSSKLNERTGNVYENKGPLWKTLDIAGML